MQPDETVSFARLEEGEKAVYDLATRLNLDVQEQYVSSGTYYFYVLVDFRSVPFIYIPVEPTEDANFPDAEQISENAEGRKRVSLDIGSKNTVAFTLAIPPESFGDAGAHDVRFLFLSKESPSSGAAPSHGSHRFLDAQCIEYASSEKEVPNPKELESENRLPPKSLRFIASWQSAILYPPFGIYDPRGKKRWQEFHYGKRFETAQPQVTLTGIVTARFANKKETLYVNVLKDGRFLDELSGLIGLPKAPSERKVEKKHAVSFEFDADLSDGRPHNYQFLLFEEPFGAPLDAAVRDSNTIFLQMSGD